MLATWEPLEEGFPGSRIDLPNPRIFDMAGPRYLLDTHILSIAKVGEDAICTSIVVAGKLRCGAAKKGSPVLSDKIGQLLSTIEVLPLEEGADEKYAEVRTALERAGTLIGANDLLIATRALSLSLPWSPTTPASFQECQDSGWKTGWHLDSPVDRDRSAGLPALPVS